jgi:hypothetical protein
MYATVTLLHFDTAEAQADAHAALAALATQARMIDGFCDYRLIHTTDRETIMLTSYRDRDRADAAAEQMRPDLRAALGALVTGPPMRWAGDVVTAAAEHQPPSVPDAAREEPVAEDPTPPAAPCRGRAGSPVDNAPHRSPAPTVGDARGGEDVVSRWCDAGQRHDAAAAAACLTTDVELISPLTDRFRFRGRDQVHDLLTAAFSAIDDIRFHTVVGQGNSRALFYRARLGTRVLEEAQLLRLVDTGLISEITLFARPIPAVTGLMSTLGPALARGQNRPRLAALLAAGTASLHAIACFGDQRMTPLIAP